MILAALSHGNQVDAVMTSPLYWGIALVLWCIIMRIHAVKSSDVSGGTTFLVGLTGFMIVVIWPVVITLVTVAALGVGLYRLVTIGTKSAPGIPNTPKPRGPTVSYTAYAGSPVPARDAITVDKETYERLVKDNEEMKKILGS